MAQVKPDKSTEVRYLFTVIASSVLLFLIFGTVWIVKKIKEGVV